MDSIKLSVSHHLSLAFVLHGVLSVDFLPDRKLLGLIPGYNMTSFPNIFDEDIFS